ncbi:GumC family protein [Porphyrobacter sp. ULC335]|uniref:GumC family protein n=1 Tax=Porphyrobacter sp. ULC335 TaxID=2854260 RepID=UPI00221F4220|nr:polysaccharide biosynthesis tyrosine autokinase [Porphyrobacter sp. ULC335]UYV15856.1 polysaccharide biosynthesis tyrosine autokinase [Porphyrobacter sp. ULC335]
MTERPIISSAEPAGQGNWLDPYIASRQMAVQQPSTQLINVSVIRGILFRQRWLVAGVLFAAATIGLIITLLVTPMYQATAKVSVKPYGETVVESQNDQSVPTNQIYEYLSTLVERIKSRKLAAVVVDNLKLAERNDLLGPNVDEGRAPGTTDAQWQAAKREMAISKIADSVIVEAPQGNWVIEIGVQSESPVLAAEIANGYADAFVESDTQTSVESNKYALSYLTEQIEQTRARLQGAEEVANEYARSRGIIVQPVGGMESEDSGTAATLTSAKLGNINQRFIEARAARIAAEERWRAVQNLPASQLPEVQTSASLQGLVADLTAKRAQLAELRQRYNNDFPQIVNLRAQIDTINAQLERSTSDIKSALRNQLTVTRNQEQALARELEQLTGATLGEQDQKVELSVLDREAQALRDQLKILLDRYNEVTSAANVNPGTLQTLDAALVPSSPYSPNLLRNLSIALALGVALAAGLAVLRETFDDRIRSLEDVEDKLGLPFIGYTPYVAERDISIDGSNRFSALMEAYSSIRAGIDFSLPRSSNVIQMTSSQAGEGKSTTSVVLAEMFASFGRKTLLVDADLRRPSVAKLLGIEKPKVGLVEVVLGHVQLEDAIVKGVHENLEILPIGEVPPNPTEILASQEFADFIDRCRGQYSLVIFDSCPVMGLADAPMLARLVDATVFVLEANTMPFSRARAAVRRISAAGGKTVGAILTKYRALEAGQSYDYQYTYYQYGPRD